MRAAVVFLALLASSVAQSDFYLCEVVVPNFCATLPSAKRQSCLSNPTLTLQGNSYDITTGFNVISFGDFDTDGSDTQGRVLAAGNGNMQAGYSIGQLIYTEGVGAVDTRYPYSAIFGGNVNWPSGDIQPDGSDTYSAAYEEFLYVGGTFTGASYLAARETTNVEPDLSSDLSNAQAFYSSLQTYFDGLTDNMDYTTQYGTCAFTCSDSTASTYSVHMASSDLASCTSWTFTSCSSDVQMIITIPDDSTSVYIKSGINAADRDASRTVFNVLGSGRTIQFSQDYFMGILLAPNNDYSVLSTAPGVSQGIFIVNSVVSSGQFNRINCSTPIVVAQPQPCVPFEATCAGTTFTAPGSSIQGDTRDYNVISFGNFVANTGDIEGRLMVRDNAVFGNGYSIGYMLQTANNLVDRQEAYALLAGGSCTWGSGAIFPDGSNVPYAGEEEGIFCGESFSGPADLASRNAGPCGTTGCLESIFDDALQCYLGYAAEASTVSSNVDVSVSFDALILTCADYNAESYSVSIDASMFTQFTYYTTSNCAYQAYWTINVPEGTGDVYLSGGSFPAPQGAVVYNIPGERNIFVDETAVNGHILAPSATLNQTGGVIYGKVVIGNVVSSLQINKEDECVTLTYTPVPVTSGNETIPAGNTSFCPSPANPPVSEDAVFDSDYYPANTTIISKDGDGCLTTSQPPISEIAIHSKIGTVAVPSNAGGNTPTTPASTSAASSVVACFVVIAAALLF